MSLEGPRCPRCGSRVGGQRFCPNCGNRTGEAREISWARRLGALMLGLIALPVAAAVAVVAGVFAGCALSGLHSFSDFATVAYFVGAGVGIGVLALCVRQIYELLR